MWGGQACSALYRKVKQQRRSQEQELQFNPLPGPQTHKNKLEASTFLYLKYPSLTGGKNVPLKHM